MGDDVLMANAMVGDKNAFARIVDAYVPRLIRFASRMVSDRDAAGDIVQEAFVKIWLTRQQYQPKDAVRPFLFRVVRNCCIDYLRSTRSWNKVRIDDDVEIASPSCYETVTAGALGDAIDQALLQLPETQRAVFVLSEYEGLTYQEIAEILGCPHGTVASRKYAAMEALRKVLRPWLEGEEDYE